MSVNLYQAIVFHNAAKLVRSGGKDLSRKTLVSRQVLGSNEEALVNGWLEGGMPAGEGVVEHASIHTDRRHERVADRGLVVHRPSNESATVAGAVCGGKGSVEDAAFYDDLIVGAAKFAHKAPVGPVAALAAVDVDRTEAVGEPQRAMRFGHQAAGKLCAGGDGTGHGEILDDRILDMAERSGVVFCSIHVECQRVPFSVESALERVGIARPHHLVDADVVRELHELAAEGNAAVDNTGEVVPVGRAFDNEGVGLRARVIEEFR